MSPSKVTCPKCKESLMKKSLDGKTRLRSRLVYWGEDNKCFAVCGGCKTPVPVPLVTIGDAPATGKEKLIVLD